jgi:hypothetical protein
LLVGHHRQRLERGLGEPRLLPVEHERLDDRRELLARVVPPATRDVAQLEASPLVGVLTGEVGQGRRHLGHGRTHRRGQRRLVERLVGDHQQRLQRRTQLRDRDLQHVLGHGVSSWS